MRRGVTRIASCGPFSGNRQKFTGEQKIYIDLDSLPYSRQFSGIRSTCPMESASLVRLLARLMASTVVP